MEFEEMCLEDVRPLRTRVLRPWFSDDEVAHFEGDEAPSAHHFGLRTDEGEVCAVVTYLPEPAPEGLGSSAVRLRGMAVDKRRRREGLGRRLLQASLTRLAVEEPEFEIVWCRARLDAAAFYEKEGFSRHGEVFEVERIGPHVVMWREMPKTLAR